MDFSKIPEELKSLDHWVCCWRDSKVPMKAYERRAASSTDKATWSNFEQAVWAVENGHYDNIGFVFTDTDYVGVDLDAGFDDGLMNPLTVDIVKACKSYTEKSRSGRGVHIILKGRLPFSGKNNQAGVEIYSSKRYFIMTGKQLIFDKIIENQKAIDYIVSTYFKEEDRETEGKPQGSKIYSPIYKKPVGKKMFLQPEYPDIPNGARNISLTSLAGAMRTVGYTQRQIYKELLTVNQLHCHPPLEVREIESIVSSIGRYKV